MYQELKNKIIHRTSKKLLFLSFVSGITVLLGFLRETTFAHYFGASKDLDAFYIALSVPRFLVIQVASITGLVLIPEYIKLKALGDNERATLLINRWFWFVFKASAVVCVLLALFSDYVIHLIAPGFTPELQLQARNWLIILLVYVWILNCTSSFKVVLDSNQAFALPLISSGIISVFLICTCFIFGDQMEVGMLLPGFIIGAGVVFLLQWYRILQYERRLPSLKLPSKQINIPFTNAGILLIVSFTAQLSQIVDRAFASTLSEGSVSAYNYANALISVPSAVLTTVISTTLYPILSKYAAKDAWHEVKNTGLHWVKALMIFNLIPIILLIVFRDEIISLIYVHGKFDQVAGALTSSILSILPITIAIGAGSELLTRAVIIQKQMHYVAMLAIASIILKVIFNYIFVPMYGLKGLAIASVCATSIMFMLRLVVMTTFKSIQK